VELERRDGWGWHAVAHVLEMQDRRRDGVAWLKSDATAWSEGSFFVVHNWWHLALFHLGLEETDEVLALVDARIVGPASPVVRNMVDASALLWRMMLRGVAVGDRWQALADRWAAVTAAGSHYAFNDLHAMMAFVGAGREVRDVGHDAAHAMHAFATGEAALAVKLLRPLRSHANRFGGSHAQRDVIDLTLIAAAEESGQQALAQALRRERAAPG
jgi:hypothetical protein